MSTFDPDAAASPDAGVFGLPHTLADARVALLPVPFDATTSYRRGASKGPGLIKQASLQVDLFDREVGKPYEAGIFMLDESDEVRRLNKKARKLAEPIIEVGGAIGDDARLAKKLAQVNEISEKLNEWVYGQASALLSQGKLLGVVGGDHATPFGAIRAIAERHPGVGILHVDAHADLRVAFEGFTWSHASIMHNVMTRLPQVSRLVQLGIRDFGEQENAMIEGSGGRIATFFDADVGRRKIEGEPFAVIAREVVAQLPAQVYVSFDIDGLDPALCPGTGTPVPGGLSFYEACFVIAEIVRSSRTIVGFDLNEVAPGPDDDELNGNVGARLLYKLIGHMLASQPKPAQPAG